MMMAQLLDPQLLLALAKVTAILMAALVLASLVKRPDLRASLLTISILSLPLVFVCSYSYSVLELIPHESEPVVSKAPPVESKSIGEIEPYVASESIQAVDSPQAVSHVAADPVPVEKPKQAESSAEIPMLLVVYLSGAFLVSIPWMFSFLQLFLLKKTTATGMPNEVWNSLFSRLSLRANLKFTRSPSAPFASGLIKPAILIPNDSVDWNPRRLQSVLLHEAAHLKRRDPLTRFLSTVVKSLFWFHPLVWLAHRQLIAAQEQACDQFALTHGIAPTDYAEDLLQSATHSQTTPSEALAMARWSQLGNRIRHILNTESYRPCTLKHVIYLCGIFAIAAVPLSTVGFATENEEVVNAESFLSEEEAEALDALEKIRVSFGPKHPKAIEQNSKIPELKLFLEETGSCRWQLTTGPHLFDKGEAPEDLTRLFKLVPDLKVILYSEKNNKVENLTSLMKSLQVAGAVNLVVAMAKEEQKTSLKFGGIEKATAVVQVHPSALTPGIQVNYLENEMASIVSPETLEIANQSLRLGIDSEMEAIKYLKKHISVRPRRGTDFLEIGAAHQDKAVAVEIVNAVAKAYQQRRKEFVDAKAKASLEALDKEMEMQNQLVRKHRDELIDLLRKDGGEPGSVQLKIDQVEVDLKRIQTAKKAGDYSSLSSFKRAGDRFSKYYQAYQDLQNRAEATLRAGLGRRHPEVVSLQGQADRALKNFTVEVETFEKELRENLDRLKWMRVNYHLPENLKGKIFIARQEYEKARKMSREMSVKQQEQRVLLSMPRTPVTIHELVK